MSLEERFFRMEKGPSFLATTFQNEHTLLEDINNVSNLTARTEKNFDVV